jgi:biopolymer transport protein ExbB
MMMAAAQAQSGAAPLSSPEELTMWKLIESTGWVIVPLLACSVAVITLVVFNFMTMRESAIVTADMEKRIPLYLEKADLEGLSGYVAERPQAVARVLDRTLKFMQRQREAGADAIKTVAEAEGGRIAAVIHQRSIYLMDIGVLAPMIGLLGTVVGILRSFGSIAQQEATNMRTLLLAGGVSQALVATAIGLIVGLIAMGCYAYFRGRVMQLITLLEITAAPFVQETIIAGRRHRS